MAFRVFPPQKSTPDDDQPRAFGRRRDAAAARPARRRQPLAGLAAIVIGTAALAYAIVWSI